MDVYMYQAALLCEDCGRKIRKELDKAGKSPEDPNFEESYESDDYPKGPYPDGGGESDSPQHCDECGVFLENALTDAGREYVEEMIAEHKKKGRHDPKLIQEWAEFYEIPFESEEEEVEENPKVNYEVIVGNIGTVHRGHSKQEAEKHYREYVSQSKEGYGRAAGEGVALMADDEIVKEHSGSAGERQENPKRGPGKFSTDLDAVLYDMSLEGPDEELGDVQGFGYYCLLRNVTVEEVEKGAKEAGVELSDEELDEIVSTTSAIIHENDQGQVEIDLYDPPAAEKDWKDLEKEYEKFETEAEGE